MDDSKPIVTAFAMEVDEPSSLIEELTCDEMIDHLQVNVQGVQNYIDDPANTDVLRAYAAAAGMYLAAICEKFGELRNGH